VAFGLSLILFRSWWVRERIDYYRGLAERWEGTRIARKAADKLSWYETHRAEAERRNIYLGVGASLVGVILFFLL
jgi:hypothetical protein